MRRTPIRAPRRAAREPVVLRMIRISRKPETVAKYKTELEKLIRKVGDPWGGGGLLTEAYDISIRIARAPIAEKVALARRRRGVLKAIALRARP